MSSSPPRSRSTCWSEPHTQDKRANFQGAPTGHDAMVGAGPFRSEGAGAWSSHSAAGGIFPDYVLGQTGSLDQIEVKVHPRPEHHDGNGTVLARGGQPDLDVRRRHRLWASRGPDQSAGRAAAPYAWWSWTMMYPSSTKPDSTGAE